jgi:hypothetical protein
MRLEQPRGRCRLAAALAVGLVLVLAAAGCGGSPDGGGEVATLGGQASGSGDGDGDGAASKDPQQAALDYARCMREHGIDMPDPTVDAEGRVEMRLGSPGGRRPDPKKLEAAQRACGRPFGGEKGRGRLDPEAEEAMLNFARCMREQGIDMPDPGDGGLVFEKGSGLDPRSPAFREAEQACKHHLDDLKRARTQSGGRP